MARARKGGGKSRLDLRREAEAVEARDREEETEGGEEEEAADDGDDGDGDDESGGKAKAKPKKKAAAAKKPAAPKRTRVKEAPRMKAVWVVFDNGSKRVKEFAYPQKADAEKFLAEKQEEKKGTFYLSLVKDPLDS